MRTLLLVSLFAAFFMQPLLSLAQDVDLPTYFAADRNNDEKIDQNEMVSHVVVIFVLLDENDDGVLTADELDGADPDRVQQMDTDGSGTLDVNEATSGKLREFEEADTDGDGFLTIEEADATRN